MCNSYQLCFNTINEAIDGGDILKSHMTFDELVRKVQQQEETVAQLVRIIAATNHRISDLQLKQEEINNVHLNKG